MFSPTEIPDQDTIYMPEGFASLFIVCSSIVVHTGCVSCVCLALDVSVIQWNHWQSQHLDTGCLAYGGTLYHLDVTCKFCRVSSSLSQFSVAR